MSVHECQYVWVSALAYAFADYFCDQVYGGILTYDTGKRTLRLTGQTVLWLLGPWGPSEKAMFPRRWHDYHSYWTTHNIWDTSGANSLIKRTVWEKETQKERKARRPFCCVCVCVCDCTANKREEGRNKEAYLTFSSQCQFSERF